MLVVRSVLSVLNFPSEERKAVCKLSKSSIHTKHSTFMHHMSIPSGLILNILNTLLFQSENELNGSKDRIRLV